MDRAGAQGIKLAKVSQRIAVVSQLRQPLANRPSHVMPTGSTNRISSHETLRVTMKTIVTRRSLVLASAALPLCGRVPKAAAASFDLAGHWVYRSFHNVSDPAEDFGKLRLALATMEVPAFAGHDFTGTLTSANWQLSLA